MHSCIVYRPTEEVLCLKHFTESLYRQATLQSSAGVQVSGQGSASFARAAAGECYQCKPGKQICSSIFVIQVQYSWLFLLLTRPESAFLFLQSDHVAMNLKAVLLSSSPHFLSEIENTHANWEFKNTLLGAKHPQLRETDTMFCFI